MTIVTESSAEYDAVKARIKAGELKWSILEVGFKVPDGVTKNGRPKFKRIMRGWTWTVYEAKNKALL